MEPVQHVTGRARAGRLAERSWPFRPVGEHGNRRARSGSEIAQDDSQLQTLAIRLDEPGPPAQGDYDLEVQVPRLVGHVEFQDVSFRYDADGRDVLSHIDLCIANGENSASGFGITPRLAEELFSCGIEVLTGGNHIWDRKEILDFFPQEPRRLVYGPTLYDPNGIEIIQPTSPVKHKVSSIDG